MSQKRPSSNAATLLVGTGEGRRPPGDDGDVPLPNVPPRGKKRRRALERRVRTENPLVHPRGKGQWKGEEWGEKEEEEDAATQMGAARRDTTTTKGREALGTATNITLTEKLIDALQNRYRMAHDFLIDSGERLKLMDLYAYRPTTVYAHYRTTFGGLTTLAVIGLTIWVIIHSVQHFERTDPRVGQVFKVIDHEGFVFTDRNITLEEIINLPVYQRELPLFGLEFRANQLMTLDSTEGPSRKLANEHLYFTFEFEQVTQIDGQEEYVEPLEAQACTFTTQSGEVVSDNSYCPRLGRGQVVGSYLTPFRRYLRGVLRVCNNATLPTPEPTNTTGANETERWDGGSYSIPTSEEELVTYDLKNTAQQGGAEGDIPEPSYANLYLRADNDTTNDTTNDTQPSPSPTPSSTASATPSPSASAAPTPTPSPSTVPELDQTTCYSPGEIEKVLSKGVVTVTWMERDKLGAEPFVRSHEFAIRPNTFVTVDFFVAERNITERPEWFLDSNKHGEMMVLDSLEQTARTLRYTLTCLDGGELTTNATECEPPVNESIPETVIIRTQAGSVNETIYGIWNFRLSPRSIKQIYEPPTVVRMIYQWAVLFFLMCFLFGAVAHRVNEMLWDRQMEGKDLRRFDPDDFTRDGRIVFFSLDMPKELKDMGDTGVSTGS